MADSLQIASRKITKKRNQLKTKGFHIGNRVSQVEKVKFGGYVQRFKNGNIYSHHTVGTFEVHGGILKKYISRGEFDSSSHTLRRELGFPKSDEQRTDEGYPFSLFEWGEIIYMPGTRGGVAISGPIYQEWKASNKDEFGYPISSNIWQGKMEIVCFERGLCVFNKSIYNHPIWLKLRFPLLGSPKITDLSLKDLSVHFYLDSKHARKITNKDEFNKILNERFSLRKVGKKSKKIQLVYDKSKDIGIPLLPDQTRVDLEPKKVPLRVDDKSPELYDLVFKNENNAYYNIAPHCIYSRKDWTDFGLLHATDIHVAKRIDAFKKTLEKARTKYPDFSNEISNGIDNLNNWNNGFRDLIRYANSMYKKGVVDGIMATGDLVDYLYEKGDNYESGGNFKFFKDLILGKSPYPEKDHPQEELLVPIFTTLGNHDYRVLPYEIYGRLDIPVHSDKDLPQYSGYNLSKFEARVLQGGNPNRFNNDDKGRIKISTDTATKQVIPATKLSFWKKDYLTYYKLNFNSLANNKIQLGKHTILMLDTGPDKDAPDGKWDTWDAITTSFGFGSEDEEAFQVHHAPNCIGPNKRVYTLLANTLKKEEGLVFVGMHAPPVNIWKNEYPHYFRETEHAKTDELEIVNFLRRSKFAAFGVMNNNEMSKRVVIQHFKDWPLSTDAFKTHSAKNLVDFGVSRGDIDEFLRLLTGDDGAVTPIDLLLTGHDHTLSEIRLKWNSNHIKYYTDFYTENPKRYYNSKKYKGEFGIYDKVKISVVEGATINKQPTLISEGNSRVKHLEIPPYATPLNEAPDKGGWWREHKPLLIQGAPLGPKDVTNRTRNSSTPHQPSFEGCKLIIVRKNLIDKIMQISRGELSKPKYDIPFGVKGVSYGRRSIINQPNGFTRARLRNS
ncbi:hypothetical protein OOZ15_18065 [Galbibacter sp. EGI 63066]|uniref:metallophosphoesterase n=1 Tax=Galbibacter sp. EGI 63066 TaxID=2993559 RepID=UPI00224973D2|nr:metallophosphoesterase [Galbibacter sp. EGI 63066]MCX2681866.1 hypothetical protein [Galbibacter sp. EGI 63066]